MKYVRLSVFFAAIFFATVSNAQQPKAQTTPQANQQVVPTQPAVQPQTPVTQPVVEPAPIENKKVVLLMVNEMAPDQIIVFDTEGKWFDTAREISININVGTGMITGTVLSWKGTLKPKNPKVTTVVVKEIKSVSEEDFANKLDSLNNPE